MGTYRGCFNVSTAVSAITNVTQKIRLQRDIYFSVMAGYHFRNII